MRLVFGGNTYWDDINTDIYGDVYDNTSRTNNLELHQRSMLRQLLNFLSLCSINQKNKSPLVLSMQ